MILVPSRLQLLSGNKMTDFNISFKPMLTPKAMLEKGIFGGTYFNQLVDYRIFPKNWFSDLDKSYFLSNN